MSAELKNDLLDSLVSQEIERRIAPYTDKLNDNALQKLREALPVEHKAEYIKDIIGGQLLWQHKDEVWPSKLGKSLEQIEKKLRDTKIVLSPLYIGHPDTRDGDPLKMKIRELVEQCANEAAKDAGGYHNHLPPMKTEDGMLWNGDVRVHDALNEIDWLLEIIRDAIDKNNLIKTVTSTGKKVNKAQRRLILAAANSYFILSKRQPNLTYSGEFNSCSGEGAKFISAFMKSVSRQCGEKSIFDVIQAAAELQAEHYIAWLGRQ